MLVHMGQRQAVDTWGRPAWIANDEGALAGQHIEGNAQQDAALMQVLRYVGRDGYRFTTPTPATHQRVLARHGMQPGSSLQDIYGWNRPFRPDSLKPDLLDAMQRAQALATVPCLGSAQMMVRSRVRIASLNDDLYLHSAYPTTQDSAVFFGPDSYRFARLIRHAMLANQQTPQRVLDVGCGSGVGGLLVSRLVTARSLFQQTPEVTLNDINPQALRYARINAAVAGIDAVLAPGDALAAVDGEFDFIVCNPPYLDDASQRTYRHGGARLGRALSVRIAQEALDRLAPGGQLLMYTGVAIENGVDALRTELLGVLESAGCDWSYEELDPDVFGEELARPVYANTDRIAAVGLVARRAGAAS